MSNISRIINLYKHSSIPQIVSGHSDDVYKKRGNLSACFCFINFDYKHIVSPLNCIQGYALYINISPIKMKDISHTNPNALILLSSFVKCRGISRDNKNVYAAVNGITAHREAMKNTSKITGSPCYLLSSSSKVGTLC